MSTPSENNTTEVVECLHNGGAVLLPTDTVYGLAASPIRSSGVDKVFDLKQRPRDRHLPIMVASSEQLLALGVDINPTAQKIIASELIPGDMTLVLGFKDKPLVPWLEGRDEIAFRVPKHKWLLKVLAAAGPLLVTSANRHGGGITPNNVSEILTDLHGEPDMVVDGGLVENVPSTILNCRVSPLKIERPGGITMEEIEKIIKTG